MDEQVLNKKLAEWAGFKESGFYKMGMLAGHIQYSHPNGTILLDNELPDFTQSLDACFKWLVPKLNEECPSLDKQIEICIYKPHPSCDFNWGCYIGDFRDFRTGDNPALALCLVIEKLIGGE